MRGFFSLFGKSPFPSLVSHMENVALCVRMLRQLFISIEQKQTEKIEEIAEEISRLEHIADMTKVEIRNHLPKGTYLPVDRMQLLQILTIQDRLADTAEDIARLATLKPLTLEPFFAREFFALLSKNLDAFETVYRIIRDWQDLVESSFGKTEVQRMGVLIEQTAHLEHAADLLQHALIKLLYRDDHLLPYPLFFLWQKIIQRIGDLSNLSENLANHVQTVLEWR